MAVNHIAEEQLVTNSSFQTWAGIRVAQRTIKNPVISRYSKTVVNTIEKMEKVVLEHVLLTKSCHNIKDIFAKFKRVIKTSRYASCIKHK